MPDPPRQLIVTPQQYEAGYKVLLSSSRRYAAIRRLDDGNYLVVDPASDYLDHWAQTPVEIAIEARQGSTTPIPWTDPKDFAAASASTLQELQAVQALGREAAVEPMSPSLRPDSIPQLLRDIAPRVGGTWMWEPLKPHARERTRVTDVRWNGEEVWVGSESAGGKRAWNELSRWVEAAVLVEPPPE